MHLNNRDILVSVLIPSFNSENYLKETLESCLNQTWSRLEVIVVDDHSNDRSFSIAKAFQSNYPKQIQIFRNPGKGACAARNYAFSVCSGKYIQYLDADDLLDPQKIEVQVRLLERSDSNTISNCRWGRFCDTIENTKWEDHPNHRSYKHAVNWLKDSWSGLGMMAQHGWLTPRHLIEKAGPWNEKLEINQDGEFFARVLAHASALLFCDQARVHYRSGNPQSISQKKPRSREKAASLLYSYKLYQEHILRQKDTEEMRKALGNNYLNFIYQFDGLFPDLSDKAKQHFRELNLERMWPVGGKNFKMLVRLLGFTTALRLKNIF